MIKAIDHLVLTITDAPVIEVADHMAALGSPVVAGASRKTGAAGPLTSVYFCDRDGNLIEIANQA